MREIRTIQGDTLDQIAWRETGSLEFVPAIIDENPHVAYLDPVLPIGTYIRIPDSNNTSSETLSTDILLWD